MCMQPPFLTVHGLLPAARGEGALRHLLRWAKGALQMQEAALDRPAGTRQPPGLPRLAHSRTQRLPSSCSWNSGQHWQRCRVAVSCTHWCWQPPLPRAQELRAGDVDRRTVRGTLAWPWALSQQLSPPQDQHCFYQGRAGSSRGAWEAKAVGLEPGVEALSRS